MCSCYFVTNCGQKVRQLVSIEIAEATVVLHVYLPAVSHMLRQQNPKKEKGNKWITSALNLMSNYSKHWSATSFEPHVQYHVGPSRANKTAVVGFWRRCGVEIVKWVGKTLLICPNGCMLYVTLSTMNPLFNRVQANPGNVPQLSDSLQWQFSLELDSVWHSRPRTLEDAQKAIKFDSVNHQLLWRLESTLPHHVTDSIFHPRPLTQQ